MNPPRREVREEIKKYREAQVRAISRIRTRGSRDTCRRHFCSPFDCPNAWVKKPFKLRLSPAGISPPRTTSTGHSARLTISRGDIPHYVASEIPAFRG